MQFSFCSFGLTHPTAPARWSLAICISLLVRTSAGELATFHDLGHLGGDSRFTILRGMSADGLVIVGQVERSGGDSEAIYWTQESGLVALGYLFPRAEHPYSYAFGVSADGSVIVGRSGFLDVGRAFRWTSAGGMVGIGNVPGGNLSSAANSTSADGSVLVGYVSTSSGLEAYRWIDGQFELLGFLSGDGASSEALDASADGATVIGYSATRYLEREAFIWTPNSGMVGLGFLPGGTHQSEAFAVSADGSTVVGERTCGVSLDERRGHGRPQQFLSHR